MSLVIMIVFGLSLLYLGEIPIDRVHAMEPANSPKVLTGKAAPDQELVVTKNAEDDDDDHDDDDDKD